MSWIEDYVKKQVESMTGQPASAGDNSPSSLDPNNPYAGLNSNSGLSVWNRLTDWLGFTNHAGQNKLASDLASRQWESQRALALEDREYNSEAATAERMRAAGLNPDLQGVESHESDTAGAQAGAGDSGAAQLAQSNLNASESVNRFFGTLGSLLTTAISAFGGIQGLVGNSIANEAARVATDKDLLDAVGGIEGLKNDTVGQVAQQLFDESISLDDFSKLWKSYRSKNNGATLAEFLADQFNITVAEVKPKFLSKRMRSSVQDSLVRHYGSNESYRKFLSDLEQTYDAIASAHKSKSIIRSGQSSPGGLDGIMQGFGELALGAEKALYKYNKTYYNAMSSSVSNIVGAQNAEAVYMKGYYGSLSSYDAAAAQNAMHKLMGQLNSQAYSLALKWLRGSELEQYLAISLLGTLNGASSPVPGLASTAAGTAADIAGIVF